MRKAILIASAIALFGCSPVGEDIKPTRDDSTFTMTIKTVSESEITAVCTQLGVKYDANGCASFNLDKKHCTIYVVPPRHVDDTARFSVIGHETWHCRFGEWHQ